MRWNLLVWALPSILSWGCATVMNKSTADVSILTEPAGADVYIDNQFVGKSPLATKVKHENHNIRVEKPGYETGVAQITSSISGWAVVGAMLIVPIIVDASTGAIHSVDEKEIRIKLAAAAGLPAPVVTPPVAPASGAPTTP